MSFINENASGCTECIKMNVKNKKRVRGLGDLVEKVAQATGIKSVVDHVAKKRGKDCGCAKRRDKLNRMMPFRGEDSNG